MEQKTTLEEKQRKGQLLKPKVDVVFHALFREENKELLSGLISDILQEEVKVVTADKNRFVEIKRAEEKLGVMDLRAELEGGIQCNVEIQLQPQAYENERILYYWADTYTRQVLRGEEYAKLEKTISIVILDHEIKALEGVEKLGIKWQIRDDTTGKRVLTDRLEIIILELPKAKRIYEKDKSNKISQWMMFLDNPNNEEVVRIMEKNKKIKSVVDELEKVSGDEKLQRIAELREKARRDENAALQYAKEHGYSEGEASGFAKGEASGLAKGRQEGEAKGKIEIVKNMLKENIELELITKITGLTKEEIEKIKSKM